MTNFQWLWSQPNLNPYYVMAWNVSGTPLILNSPVESLWPVLARCTGSGCSARVICLLNLWSTNFHCIKVVRNCCNRTELEKTRVCGEMTCLQNSRVLCYLWHKCNCGCTNSKFIAWLLVLGSPRGGPCSLVPFHFFPMFPYSRGFSLFVPYNILVYHIPTTLNSPTPLKIKTRQKKQRSKHK